MKKTIKPKEITRENFAAYGDLISSDSIKPINKMQDMPNVLMT